MKNPTQDILSAAVAARQAGMKSDQILAEFGLSHSQFEFAWLRQVELVDFVGSVEATGPNAVAMRDYFQVSWGRIAVLMDCSEAKVRSLYKEAAGLLSQGQRIGKGGRWYLNERDLYTEGLQRPGTKITEAEAKEMGRREAATVAAASQKLLLKDMAELKAIAAAEGVTVKKGTTKALLIKGILQARKA